MPIQKFGSGEVLGVGSEPEERDLEERRLAEHEARLEEGLEEDEPDDLLGYDDDRDDDGDDFEIV